MERSILFAGNRDMFDGILSCMLSILMRTESEDCFHFYIFTMALPELSSEYLALTELQGDFLDSVVKSYNPGNTVEIRDVTKLYKQYFFGCPNENCYCSPYTLLRLLADVVEDIPDKILYLDTDILFNGEITDLYDLDIGKYEYAAARDHYGKFLLHPNYINAGVLLLNLEKIRQTGMLVRSRALIQYKKLPFADQSAIFRCKKKIKILSGRYNDQRHLYAKTVIRHFSKRLFYLPYPHVESIKQWEVDRFIQVYRYSQLYDILYEYLYFKGKFQHEMMERSEG